jgi:hypothetical protein
MPSLPHYKPAWSLAGFGIISGLATTYTLELTEAIKIFDVEILPGILFGIAIAFGLLFLRKSNWTGVVLVVLMTIVSWVAAVRGFRVITNDGEAFLYLGALVAGAVGAGGTQLGAALAVGTLRHLKLTMMTIAVGAICGLLVIYPLDHHQDSWIVLFVPWQALVAAVIGYGLVSSTE